MSSLGDLQLRMRNAIVGGDFSSIAPMLAGGRDPVQRLAIHRRHYQTSLVKTLTGKFPATSWLAGESLVTEAARHFVCEHPPQAPCLSEYGEQFPRFLARWASEERSGYICQFAELEWHVGHVAVAVDGPPLSMEAFSAIPEDALTRLRLLLQTGARYVQGTWPIDDLFRIYLTDSASESDCEIHPVQLWLEVRGSRGDFRFNRLEAGVYRFRESISKGMCLGDAAASALDRDPAFDPGRALTDLVTDDLVTFISLPFNRKENIYEH